MQLVTFQYSGMMSVGQDTTHTKQRHYSVLSVCLSVCLPSPGVAESKKKALVISEHPIALCLTSDKVYVCD